MYYKFTGCTSAFLVVPWGITMQKNGKLGLAITFASIAFLLFGAPLLGKPLTLTSMVGKGNYFYVTYEYDSDAGGCVHNGIVYPEPRFDCSGVKEGKEPRDTWE